MKAAEHLKFSYKGTEYNIPIHDGILLLSGQEPAGDPDFANTLLHHMEVWRQLQEIKLTQRAKRILNGFLSGRGLPN